MLNILLTLEEGETKQRYFPPAVLKRLEQLGKITSNPTRTVRSMKQIFARVGVPPMAYSLEIRPPLNDPYPDGPTPYQLGLEP